MKVNLVEKNLSTKAKREIIKENFKMEDVDIKRFLKKVASVGFVLDPAIKHENPSYGFFRSLHFQLIDDTDFVGSDEESFDEGLFDKVARDLVKAISEFEEESGYEATYSIGVNYEGYVTAGVDIREGRNSSLGESVVNEATNDEGRKLFKEYKILVDGRLYEISHTKMRADEITKILSDMYPESEVTAELYKHYESGYARKRLERLIAQQEAEYKKNEAFDTPFEKKSKKEQEAENKKRRGELIPPNKTFKDRKKEFDKNKARGKGRYDESIELDEGAAGTLADKIRKGKLDRDAEYDDMFGDLYDDNNPNSNHTATEGEYMVQFQDRTTNTHTPRNPRDGYRKARYETHPRVKSNTWARVWKNGDLVYNNGGESRYTARQNAARYLDSIDECRKVEAVETRKYRNNRNENKYITTKHYPDGHYYERQTMEWDTPNGKVVNDYNSKSGRGRFHRGRDSKKQAWFDDYTEITEE